MLKEVLVSHPTHPKKRNLTHWSGLKIHTATTMIDPKGPNISTFCFNDFNPPAYISRVYVEDTSQLLWIFCTIQKKFLISQKVLCYKFKVSSEIWKTILYSLFNTWYTMCVFVCSMFARKEVWFSVFPVSMLLHWRLIDVTQRGSCHHEKWLKGEQILSVPNDEDPSQKTSFTLNNCILYYCNFRGNVLCTRMAPSYYQCLWSKWNTSTYFVL